MKRSPLLTSAAVLSAAGFSAAAAALVRRILRHGAVDHAVRVSSKDADTGQLPVLSSDAGGIPPSALPGWQGNMPVTPVPPDAVTATAPETAGDAEAAGDVEDSRLPSGRTRASDAGAETSGAETYGIETPGETAGNSAGDDGEPLPARTWVVDNSSDWDGNPLEMVVPPDRRPRRGQPGAAPA